MTTQLSTTIVIKEHVNVTVDSFSHASGQKRKKRETSSKCWSDADAVTLLQRWKVEDGTMAVLCI